MARRLHGVSASPEPEHLAARMTEMSEGKHDAALEELVAMDVEGLKAQYAEREIEPASEEGS